MADQACNDPVIVRKFLSKLPVDELRSIAEEFWDLSELPAVKTKRALVEQLFELCEGQLSYQQMAELDIAYNRRHTAKRWVVYRITGLPDKAVDPTALQQTLSSELGLFFNHFTYISSSSDGALWIYISFLEGSRQFSAGSTVIFVYHPRASAIIGSIMLQERKPYIIQALIASVQAEKIEEWGLEGKSVDSLYSLVLNQHSQGRHSVYRVQKFSDNPLQRVQAVKVAKPADPRVVVEDDHLHRKRDRDAMETFGPNKQPALDRILLKVSSNFTDGEPFQVTVRIDGENVFAGIKGLIPLGLVRMPLPDVLANMHSAATNSLTV
eukprot:TRINITY_DN14068_c0_g1_i1.p1 TRINITY_DN14068_c0_g1~~TRINITY_DN14068_c0_g1_i1.p1  ORF type:complete len:341 (+),score=44.54 TRINITY_DN14068_c0_g1_i1:52-1023(+)